MAPHEKEKKDSYNFTNYNPKEANKIKAHKWADLIKTPNDVLNIPNQYDQRKQKIYLSFPTKMKSSVSIRFA